LSTRKNELIAAIVTHTEAAQDDWDTRRLHPKLQMMQERVKKMRTHAEAQEGARQILGLSLGVPTMGAQITAHAHCCRRRGAIYWAALRHLNQWWIDASRSTPRHAAALTRSPQGLRRDAVETPISNAGIGSLPKMMITSPSTLCMGSGGGGASAVHHGQEGCLQRLSLYAAELTDAEKDTLQRSGT
jgi:hypothetical protein